MQSASRCRAQAVHLLSRYKQNQTTPKTPTRTQGEHIRTGSDRDGLRWIPMDCDGMGWSGMDLNGLGWIVMDWDGFEWIGMK